jgi:hypothetical protein
MRTTSTRLRNICGLATFTALVGLAAAQPQPSDPFAPPTGGFQPPAPGGFTPPTPDPVPASSPFGANAAAARSLLAEPDAVRTLSTYRFTEELRWDGKIMVRRNRLSYEEAAAFDRNRVASFIEQMTAGTLAWFPTGSANADKNVWAEWSNYAEQLALWTTYCEQTLFADNPTTHGLKDIKFPGDPKDDAAGAAGEDDFVSKPGTPERLVEQNQRKSIDDQAGDFVDFTPADGGGQGQAASFSPGDMDTQATDLYNNWLKEVRAVEEEQNKTVARYQTGLNERHARRAAYADWRADQRVKMEDVVKDWERSYDDQIATINGVRYELYRPGQVPRAVPRGAHIVETNHSLTPFDIMDENGVLLGPADEE